MIIGISLGVIGVLYSAFMGDYIDIVRIPLEVIGLFVLYAILLEISIYASVYNENMSEIALAEAITKRYFINSENLFKMHRIYEKQIANGYFYEEFEKIIMNSYGDDDIEIIKRNMLKNRPIVAASMEEPTTTQLQEAIKQASRLERKISIRKKIDFKEFTKKEVREFYAAHKNIDLSNGFKNRIIDLKTEEEMVQILNRNYNENVE